MAQGGQGTYSTVCRMLLLACKYHLILNLVVEVKRDVCYWKLSRGETKKGISGASTIKYYRFVMYEKGIDDVVS
jgi:hypothetical protein